jgi:glycosyltransferase involved in cell wall biosynthesis
MQILVVNPTLISKSLGACEQDRLANVRDLLRLGHEVRVLSRASPHVNQTESERHYTAMGAQATILPPPTQRWQPSRVRDIAFLDGAAWDYGNPDFLKALMTILTTWNPAIVWCHASYLWPPALFAKQRGFPAVLRSVNNEARHLTDLGMTLGNRLRYVGKRLGEARVTHASVLAAITPVEQAEYAQTNPCANVHLLPLRTLPGLLRHTPRAASDGPLRVYFMGASYNVRHNLSALEFVVQEIAPRLRQAVPGGFEIHVLGGKVPERVAALAAPDLIFAGYVPDLDGYLSQMDIALAPRLSGEGMQQKLFESLCRGFPTITHPAALGGYSFEDGTHMMLASTPDAYVEALLRLRDPERRAALGSGALARATELFSQSAIDERVRAILYAALGQANAVARRAG